MDTTSLDCQIEELEQADPADTVEAADRLAGLLEELLEREQETSSAPPA